MRKERRHHTGEEKVAILRRHLLNKVPVSDLCDELGLQPTVFYCASPLMRPRKIEGGSSTQVEVRYFRPVDSLLPAWNPRS